ncbi:TetR/AcrR family transcriptional regulator [Hyphomicrobium sp.]|uniref:TetR/AcrR family transcriptional regulator n=1 Tax=Hyphomicrobium sp. TaxID=82 RepID=UPI001DDCBDE4|nr:TetR/AcrR family transcriptional regulator [Hyphomicrobium sp.]MBY0559174.1 TetR/AcrR family transcriptional regulator [Hyphomicrobium sp.]
MESVHLTPEPTREDRRGGRPAAGTDPQKRRQILEGAGRIFSTAGFDASSMSDVAREARVSKATLYVYFQDKEHLFTAICAERRDRNISEILSLLDTGKPFESVLTEFSIEVLTIMSEPFVVAAHRIVIGVAERMPEVGTEFFERGPKRVATALGKFFDHHVAAGRLEIADTYFAATQFLELIQASIIRPRLYGAITERPTRDEIEKNVASAIAILTAGYGPRGQR